MLEYYLCLWAPAPGVAFPRAQVWACSHISPIWFLPFVICRSDKLPPPTHPPTATFLLHESLEGRPMAGNSLSPWSSIVDSVCHSVLTSLWSQAQLRSLARRRMRAETRKGRGWGGSGLLSPLHRLRLVLSEQSLTGPLALSGTLLPGLNNECAGLPLVLGALISSQGPVFTHEREFRNLPSCGALLLFLCVSFGE